MSYEYGFETLISADTYLKNISTNTYRRLHHSNIITVAIIMLQKVAFNCGFYYENFSNGLNIGWAIKCVGLDGNIRNVES